MKGLVILFSILLMACANNAALIPVKDTTYDDQIQDSPRIQKISFDSIISIRVDTSEYSALRRENDSLRTALFQAQFKVNKVRYYLKICLKNPSQDKFLKGWIKRAIQ